ncbi:MAG: RbsD/FucU domain-containing protein [Planctomycetaceae bacterium]|nr:RbsD/FucU domain-containing protein [Planctomycetaceae bacterium]
MLKHIPPILSPALFSVLMRMGHGDELVLADGNFPAEGLGPEVVRSDGHGVPVLLNAILQFFPVDDFVDDPALVMQPVDAQAPEPPIWSQFRRLLIQHEQRPLDIRPLDRFEFYDRARKAFAIIATGETAIYANLILKKGVVLVK